MDKLEMLVVTHKEIENKVKDRSYIRVGNAKFEAKYYDNLADNISDKNSSFCELTALYYAYKNLDYDYLSLEHYRRLFYKKNNPITNLEMLNLLKEYDVIMPLKNYLRETNYDHFLVDESYKKDLDVLREVFLEKHSDYINIYDDFFNKKNMYYYNMFAARKEIVDDYCNFLFDILFEVERRIDISNYDNYHKRIFGFLSERLLNIYLLMHNEYKIKELEVVFNNESKIKRKIGKLKNNIKKILN